MEEQRKMLQKLKLNPPLYTAIAFDWYYAEWGKPQEITFVVAWCRLFTGEDGNRDWEVKEYKFRILFGDERLPKTKGASEPIGLLPKTFSYSEQIQGTFERNVADIFIALLYKDILPKGDKYILCQGPFLPKFIGRLGYRHIKGDITIAALTFKNEWLPRGPLPLDEELKEHFRRPFFIDYNKTNYLLVDCRSPNGISEVLKSWGLQSEDKNNVPYLLELMCQFPDKIPDKRPETKSPWIEKLEDTQKVLSNYGLILGREGQIYLPFALCIAYDLCVHHGGRSTEVAKEILKGHLEYLYYYEEDIPEMASKGFAWPEITGRRMLLRRAIEEDQLFNEIRQNIRNKWNLKKIYDMYGSVPEEKDPMRRGNFLTGFIRRAKESEGWNVELWREIV